MWLYVPGLSSASVPDMAVSNVPSLSLVAEFGLWVLLSGKPTLLRSSQVEWSRVKWIRPLCGTIWNPFEANSIAVEWISSLPVSPARELASPANAAASTTSAGSGQKHGGSRRSVKLRGSLPKTSRASSPRTAGKRSDKSSTRWPRAGGLRNGIVSLREPSAPRTSVTDGSFLLPTPTASAYGSSQNGINGINGINERPSANRASLHTMAARGTLPTPQASDSKRALSHHERNRRLRGAKNGATLHEAIVKLMEQPILPTPTAQDSRASGVSGNWTEASKRHAGATLTDVAVRGLSLPSKTSGPSPNSGARTGTGGMRLNPRFVEWMMGLPAGWTVITPNNSISSATVSSSTPRRQRSVSSSSGFTEQLSLFDP